MGGLDRGEAGGWSELLYVAVGWVGGEVGEGEEEKRHLRMHSQMGGRTCRKLGLCRSIGRRQELPCLCLFCIGGWVGGWMKRASFHQTSSTNPSLYLCTYTVCIHLLDPPTRPPAHPPTHLPVSAEGALSGAKARGKRWTVLNTWPNPWFSRGSCIGWVGGWVGRRKMVD